MNRLRIGLLISILLPGLSACSTVKQQAPQVTAPAATARVNAKKLSLKNKKAQLTEIPSVLGGVVQSDNWVIYPEKKEEEFEGHVFYDNGVYQFKADYALSQRAKQLFTARGNVFLRQNDPDGSFYQAKADRASFNYGTQKGTLLANNKRQVTLTYQDEKNQVSTAHAQKVTFDLVNKIFVLEGNVHMERQTPTGPQTLQAKKVTFKQLENYALLEGNAKLADPERTLEAQTIEYDGQHNVSSAVGERPLAYGKTEQGTFAIIADRVQSDAQGDVVHLDGKVQGWVVSPQLNDEKINSKF